MQMIEKLSFTCTCAFFVVNLQPNLIIKNMKHIFILICVICCSLQTMATNLVIEHRSGAEVLQDIAIIGKCLVVGENIQLLDKSGNVLAIEALSNIKKITLLTSDTSEDVNDTIVNTIVVYPNPTQELLIIRGVESQTLRIYDLQGRLLKTEWGNQISVGNLSDGTYLLQIGTQVVRFIKK